MLVPVIALKSYILFGGVGKGRDLCNWSVRLVPVGALLLAVTCCNQGNAKYVARI